MANSLLYFLVQFCENISTDAFLIHTLFILQVACFLCDVLIEVNAINLINTV